METDGFPVVVDSPAVDACRPRGEALTGEANSNQNAAEGPPEPQC